MPILSSPSCPYLDHIPRCTSNHLNFCIQGKYEKLRNRKIFYPDLLNRYDCLKCAITNSPLVDARLKKWLAISVKLWKTKLPITVLYLSVLLDYILEILLQILWNLAWKQRKFFDSNLNFSIKKTNKCCVTTNLVQELKLIILLKRRFIILHLYFVWLFFY